MAAPKRGASAAAPSPRRPSGPVEDYLKIIYDLGRGESPASTNEIARRLGVSPASVSGMVRRLAEQGLLTHALYRGVTLTRAGKRAALRTVRRHRVIETYLVRVLGYPWEGVHAEAERLEHVASDGLIERMAAALGAPREDPHGAPIPSPEGEVVEGADLPLTELASGERARVARVSDEDPALLRDLAALRLTPGAEVEMLETAPSARGLIVRIDRSRVKVQRGLAALVRVRRGPGQALAAKR